MVVAYALLHLRPAFKHEQLWVKQLLVHEHFLKPSPLRMLSVLTISRKEILAGVHGQLLMSCFSRAARNFCPIFYIMHDITIAAILHRL